MSTWRSKPRRAKIKLLLLAGLVALPSACGFCGNGADEIGRLIQVQPQVTLSRAEKQGILLHEGEPLFAGDVLTADASGSAILVLNNGARVFLQPSSAFVVEGNSKNQRTRSVRLLFGSIEAQGLGDAISVNTKMGPIQFGAENSRVRIQADGEQILVRTLLGQVTLGEKSLGKGVSVRFNRDGIVFDQPDAGAPVDAGPEDAADTQDLGEIQALVITLKRGRGVYQQAGGTGRFRPLKRDVKLARGDVLEARLGNAVVDIGGVGDLTMSKRSRVQVGDANTLFDVQKGKGRVRLQKGEQRWVSVGGARIAVRANASEADVELRKLRQGGKVQVRSGEVEFTGQDGKKLQLLANDVLQIDAKGLGQLSRLRSSPIVVTERIKRVFVAGRLKALTFNWNKGPEDQVVLFEVAKDPDFTQPVTSGLVRGQSLTLETLPFGLYYWRVKAGDAVLAQSNLRLSRDRSGAKDDARKNVVRASGERTVIMYQQYKAPLLTFKWPATAGATSYKLSVFRDGKFSKPVIERDSDKAQIKLPEGSLADGKYVWAISSVDKNGGNLATSDMYDLEIRFDSNKVLLRVISPAARSRARGSLVSTSGLVAPGASLKINGKGVSVDAVGRFSTQVKVNARRPILTYQVGQNLFARILRR